MKGALLNKSMSGMGTGQRGEGVYVFFFLLSTFFLDLKRGWWNYFISVMLFFFSSVGSSFFYYYYSIDEPLFLLYAYIFYVFFTYAYEHIFPLYNKQFFYVYMIEGYVKWMRWGW